MSLLLKEALASASSKLLVLLIRLSLPLCATVTYILHQPLSLNSPFCLQPVISPYPLRLCGMLHVTRLTDANSFMTTIYVRARENDSV